MRSTLKFLGQMVVAGSIGWFAPSLILSEYNPYELYDESKDTALIECKNKLKGIPHNSLDDENINRLWRPSSGRMFVLDVLNRYFKYNKGMVVTWNDPEKQVYCIALVRGDGKVLSDIREHKPSYDNETILHATVQNGYLIGVAESQFYNGKENYPIYKYKD